MPKVYLKVPSEKPYQLPDWITRIDDELVQLILGLDLSLNKMDEIIDALNKLSKTTSKIQPESATPIGEVQTLVEHEELLKQITAPTGTRIGTTKSLPENYDINPVDITPSSTNEIINFSSLDAYLWGMIISNPNPVQVTLSFKPRTVVPGKKLSMSLSAGSGITPILFNMPLGPYKGGKLFATLTPDTLDKKVTVNFIYTTVISGGV